MGNYNKKNCGENGSPKEWVQFKAECEGATSCTIKASNQMTEKGSDPCPGSHKHAIIKYHCEKKGVKRTKMVDEYTWMSKAKFPSSLSFPIT